MHETSSAPAAPAPEFPPGYQERYDRLAQAAPLAKVSPLPGPLTEAWLPATLQAAGFVLRPVVASDWAVLSKIRSPLITELAALGKPDQLADVSYSDDQIWELLFIWTRPPREVRAAIALGPQGWREAVFESTADRLPASVVADKAKILSAVAENLARALATSVSYAPPDGPGGEKVFSTQPQTASAGGCTT